MTGRLPTMRKKKRRHLDQKELEMKGVVCGRLRAGGSQSCISCPASITSVLSNCMSTAPTCTPTDSSCQFCPQHKSQGHQDNAPSALTTMLTTLPWRSIT
ncbi:hypothetical protein CB1_001437027 [Camelus ferus]|nr:hypothetical protein CB1_001437027 [Camelus ferus]